MLKSGLIFGAVAFVLVIVSALITPFCAPCVGLVIGLAAGYVAGVFDKPTTSSDGIKKGAAAGAIAGGLGFIGGLIGGVINASVVNPSDIEALYRALGITNYAVDQTTIWITQIGGSFCVGLFDIGWMALLGVAGGALWFQAVGKKQAMTILPPQEPTPPTV